MDKTLTSFLYKAVYMGKNCRNYILFRDGFIQGTEKSVKNSFIIKKICRRPPKHNLYLAFNGRYCYNLTVKYIIFVRLFAAKLVGGVIIFQDCT